ncbi:uncharacterized protein LOC125855289 [Solanum stenotomum]|uniref:uncharacterized protein LOC125855289 n=1 Tax=Solanum stenotomum TaxID=172797 RepID=UPI0020D01ED8|nr:uncharacterized protein LOC125855289 [Solanum stenotomum]
MVNPFICGSFHHQDDDDIEIFSPCSTPKRTKKSLLRSSNKNNPYSNRGLDKFSALLADLEDKKQRIYSEIAPDDISFVRFVFSNSNDAKPIIVKLKDKKSSKNYQEEKIEPPKKQMSREVYEDCQERKAESAEKRVIKKSVSNWSSMKWENLKRPMFYLPLTIILILVFLAIYGRSFAIMCTSIGWYLIPTIRGGDSRSSISTRKPKRKKDYMRRFSEKSVVREEPISPRSVMNGPNGKYDHRKSWS